MAEELPTDVLDRVERLTRRARAAVDENESAAYREERASVLAEHGYTARVRDEERAVLVVYPDEWVIDGVVDPERVDDVERGIEVPLEGPGEDTDWEVVAEHNDEVVVAVDSRHGDVHAANGRALAEFASNHYAKRVERLTPAEQTEFIQEYYPRNVWPSKAQAAVVEESVRLTVEVAEEMETT